MRGTLVTQVWRPDPSLYAPRRYRKPCEYDAFIPDPLADAGFTIDARVAAAVSEAEKAIHELNSSSAPALAPLARLLLRTESIASSKVEGIQVGARELARAEVRSRTGGRAGPAASEVLANIDAMEVAIGQAASSDMFGIEDLTAIHRQLMERSPHSHIAGSVRTVQNWIGGNDYNPCGADFVPPPPEHVNGLLDDLCRAVNDDSLSPLAQAAMVHAQFETIHPFEDGNGRTGRGLVHVVLRRRSVAPAYVPPISVVLARERDAYIRGLERFREGEIESWLKHFASATTTAARLASAYLEAVSQLTDDWRGMLSHARDPRADAAAWALIDVLPAHPIITSPVAIVATGRAKSAVHQAIDDLVDAGVLLPLSQTKRNRTWEAVGLFDLLEGLEAGEPMEAA